MILKCLNIEPTDRTPRVKLNPDGFIVLEGRSYNNASKDFYKQVDEWIDDYIKFPSEITIMNLYLEYFDHNSSLILSSLINKLAGLEIVGKVFQVNWYFDEDDDDILAMGEKISYSLNVPINYVNIKISRN